ncbi:MAG: MFS transporter [Burkholderiaceae bacterium]
MKAASPVATNESYRWIVLAAAVFSQAAGSITHQGLYPLVPFFQSAFHLTQASAALLITAANGGQIITIFVFGMCIDRFGERRVVSLTMVAMGLAAIMAAAMGSTYGAVLAWVTFLGAMYASIQPGGTRAIVQWFPPGQRGLATGTRQAAVVGGMAVAATILPVLASHYGWKAAMLFQGFIGIAGGLLFLGLHRDRRTAQQDREANDEKAVTPSAKPLETIRSIAAFGALWPVMLSGAAMAVFQFTFATHIISFLAFKFQASIVGGALLFSISQWVGVVARIALPWSSDKLWPGQRIRTMWASMIVCVIATLALLALPPDASLWAVSVFIAVIGFFGIGWYPLYLLQVAEMASANSIASTLGFAMTLNMIAVSIMPPLFGWIVDMQGFPLAWLVLVALVSFSAVVLAQSRKLRNYLIST